MASQDKQEDATERAFKRMRRDKPYEFRCKGHEEQYRVNLEVADHMAAATSHISKLQPSTEKDKITLERAEKELEEGTAVLAERQKHIRIANQSEHSCFPFLLPVSVPSPVFLGFHLPIYVCTGIHPSHSFYVYQGHVAMMKAMEPSNKLYKDPLKSHPAWQKGSL